MMHPDPARRFSTVADVISAIDKLKGEIGAERVQGYV